MKEISATITLSKSLRELLDGDLVDKIVTERDMALVASQVHYFILARTARGEFLNKGYRKTYTNQHKRRRLQDRGYTNEEVTLFMSGAMLGALQTEIKYSRGIPEAHVGYFDGQTDPDILDLASFHNVLGAGKNHVVREFVGLTNGEAASITNFLKRRIDKNLN